MFPQWISWKINEIIFGVYYPRYLLKLFVEMKQKFLKENDDFLEN